MTEIKILKDILSANEDVAGQNRARFKKHGILALNLIASPGAGKTTLVERTIQGLSGKLSFAVIEGDITGDLDARRIAKAGAAVVQVNTEGGCHLNAAMVDQALGEFMLDALDIIIIENVGNLVCPAEFDLGESLKVVVLSVPEGDDKPAKYPLIFSEAGAVVINKVDLLAATDFDLEKAERDIRKINPDAPIFRLSCRTGAGTQTWFDWLAEQRKVNAAK
ncbi:MAG: hydrogenase nickel incorporation protein HypB [Candidatus Edwardsbacteria bacterium]|nr:hydrogenase nickel incorporation protein HypB [Candidatus Edwardsbacteria bacterium]